MTLLSRIIKPVGDEIRISSHPFTASVGELIKGVIPKSKIVTDFNLTAAEEQQFDSLMALIQSGAFTRREFEDNLTMGESGFLTESEILTRLNP